MLKIWNTYNGINIEKNNLNLSKSEKGDSALKNFFLTQIDISSSLAEIGKCIFKGIKKLDISGSINFFLNVIH